MEIYRIYVLRMHAKTTQDPKRQTNENDLIKCTAKKLLQ